jgi:hypothetical protein
MAVVYSKIPKDNTSWRPGDYARAFDAPTIHLHYCCRFSSAWMATCLTLGTWHPWSSGYDVSFVEGRQLDPGWVYWLGFTNH